MMKKLRVVTVRMTEKQHIRYKEAAKRVDKSLNEWCLEILDSAAEFDLGECEEEERNMAAMQKKRSCGSSRPSHE